MRCPNCGAIVDPPRNRDQQGKLHALLTTWARWDGVDLDGKKIEAKIGFGAYVTWAGVEAGHVPPPAWPNRIIDLADIYVSHPRGSYVFVQSEASFSRAQEAAFISWVERRMMDAHIPLEDI